MKPYELLYIVPAVMTDAEAEAVSAKVSEMISAVGGNIIRTQSLGKIKLAYAINRQKYGFYILTHFDADPATIAKLENALRLHEHVLRHQLIGRPAGAENKTYKLEAYQSPINEEGFAPRRLERETKRRPNQPAVSAAPLAKSGPEMTIEELDKKLDAILEGTSENV